MQQRVEPGKVENLSRNLEHLRQTIEHSLTGLSNELTRLLSSVESAYSESYVRAAAREVSEQLHEIMKFAEALDERMRDKVKVLNYAANEYLQIEKKAVGLAKATKPAYFTLKGAAQAWLKGFKNRALQNITDSGDPFSKSKLSLVQIAKGVLLEFREMSLESRVAPVKEDARVAALLLMVETGTVEDQAWAREKLEEIAKTFEELARHQAAYQVYEIYGNEMYTGYVHKLADKQRSNLADLGISEEWYRAGVSHAAFYKGSPLTACDYNPLKHDFSTMPSESELRMVIAVGLFNEAYRSWARNNYSRIEAAVHQAVEQQRKLEEQLEEYNRLVPEEDIRKMQQVLKDLNIYQGEITGKYNEELLIAVAGYQYIANTISSVAAVWRSQSKSGKYEFEVDGKVTKELLELALAEKGMGIRNNPDLVINNGGTITAVTMVGVGDGIVSQLKEDIGDAVKGGWANNTHNIEFWTKTLPHYYDLAKAIENGTITYDSIKEMFGEAIAQECIVPVEVIMKQTGKVLSGKASYEESVSYGRAIAKVASLLTLAKAGITAGAKGAKLASKSSKELLESLPKITEQFRRPEFVTPEGIRVKVPALEADGTISYSKNPNPTQQNFIENYLKEREGKGRVEGTGETAMSVIDKEKWLGSLQNTDNFKQGTKENGLNHIFDGEVLKNGKANGFHSEGMPNSNGKIVGNIDPPNEFGVYRANIEINGVPKKPKSTFFPKEWTPQQVIDAVNEAFYNKEVAKNNVYRGVTSKGMEIEFILRNDKIISAYPIY